LKEKELPIRKQFMWALAQMYLFQDLPTQEELKQFIGLIEEINMIVNLRIEEDLPLVAKMIDCSQEALVGIAISLTTDPIQRAELIKLIELSFSPKEVEDVQTES